MDIWFVKNKAFYFAEELIALLYNVTLEIETKQQEKLFTESDIRALSNEFFSVINLKVAELKKDLKYRDPEFLDFFQMAIVAMIDDVFLTMSWSGRGLWSAYLLEMRIFSSRASGDIFFDNCRKILSRHDQKFKELAAIYHLCLAAGFRGKYLHSEYNEEIHTIKTDLYNFFMQDANEVKEASILAVLPSGYVENQSKSTLMKKYTFFNRLLFLNFVFVVGFVIASYFIWFHNENLIFRNL